MIRRILRKQRTAYGKTIRKDYEAGRIKESRHNFTEYAIRPDEISNTLSTVTKDNLLVEIHGVCEKESDNLTYLNNHYDADEQYDFTQTEAEEWAVEIALRIKEGNLDPIPTNKPKKFEQYDFTYASLFSGIGGFEQALNNFGGQCVFASEIDKFAAQAYETLYGEKPHGDITKIPAEDIPDHDLLVGGFPCFAAGTLITTSEGLKPIEEVRKGDKVLTHTNTFKDVVVPMVKRKKGIYELKVQGSPSTLITEEHPLYVREMYREWNNERRSYERKWTEPKWVEAKDLEKGKHFVGMSENKNGDNPLNITYEEAWLIGRYVADGYIRNADENNLESIIFCVGKDKIQEFEQEVKEHHVGITEDKSVYRCRINTERLNSFCKEVGRGANNKRIPGFIFDLPNNLLERFLDGYMSGDGCYTNAEYQATSVSRELIYGLAQIVQKLYNTPYSITYTKRPKTTVIEGRTVNQRDTWMIRFRKKSRKQQDGVYIDGMLWMPIRSLEYNEDFDDLVYNFEVEGDNSYVANNLTVHNCQAFSVAGKRKGFEDTRGTLFFEIARIAKEKRPKALLLENVKGLVNHDKGRTLDVMIETLNEIGYTVDFDILNSKYFGVPQNRERIFIVAIRDDLIEQEDWSEETTKGQTVVPKGKRRLMKYSWLKSFNFDFPEQIEVTTRLRDILEPEVDEKYYLDEEKTAKLVAQLNDDAGLGKDGELGTLVNGVNISPTIDASYAKGLGPSDVAKNRNRRPMFTEPQMLGHVDGIKGHDAIKRTYSTEGISPTLTTMGGGHREPKIAERQTVIDDTQGFDGVRTYDDETPTLRSERHGLKVAEEVRPVLTPERMEKRQNGRRFKEDDEPAFTVNTQDRHGVAIREATKKGYAIAEEGDSVNVQFPGSKTRRGRVGKEVANTLEASSINQGTPIKEGTRYRIRKLTPLECWRLQGFPDEAHQALVDAGISDSQRYKQAGNAVTVNVIEAIGERLIPLITAD